MYHYVYWKRLWDIRNPSHMHAIEHSDDDSVGGAIIVNTAVVYKGIAYLQKVIFYFNAFFVII